MTSPLDLDAIQARADAATEGPWDRDIFEEDGGWEIIPESENWDGVEIAKLNRGRTADATFIAHARTDIPALVAEVRALRERMAQAASLIDECMSQHEGPYDPCGCGARAAQCLLG